jgi:hypothetical protein
MLDEYDDEPGDPDGWDEWAHQLRDAYWEDRVAEVIKPFVDDLLDREGLLIDAQSRERLEEQVLGYGTQLASTLEDRAKGNYRPDGLLETFPEWGGAQSVKGRSEVSRVATLFDAWAVEKQFVPKSRSGKLGFTLNELSGLGVAA